MFRGLSRLAPCVCSASCGRVQRAVFQSSELADVLTEAYFCSASRETRRAGRATGCSRRGRVYRAVFRSRSFADVFSTSAILLSRRYKFFWRRICLAAAVGALPPPYGSCGRVGPFQRPGASCRAPAGGPIRCPDPWSDPSAGVSNVNVTADPSVSTRGRALLLPARV